MPTTPVPHVLPTSVKTAAPTRTSLNGYQSVNTRCSIVSRPRDSTRLVTQRVAAQSIVAAQQQLHVGIERSRVTVPESEPYRSQSGRQRQ